MSDLGYIPLFASELEPLKQHEDRLSDEMAQSLASHTNPVDGFSVLEKDYKKYPFQRIDCYRVLGTAATKETMDALGAIIYPRFTEMVDYLTTDRKDLLVHIADNAERGVGTNLITDHCNVIGVAVCGAVVSYSLYESGVMDHGDIDTEIYVSTMLKRTALFGSEAAIKLAAQVFSSTRFSLPSINEKNREVLSSEDRALLNRVSRMDQETDGERPLLRSIAASATRDIRTSRRFGRSPTRPTWHMGPMSDGTIKDILSTGYNLPMGLEMSDKQHTFFTGTLGKPTSSTAVGHNIMHEIATGMTEQAKYPRTYHRTREEFKKATTR